MTMIVEDTIAIGRRLREIQERESGQRQSAEEFKMPDDILIMRAAKVSPPLRFSPDYEVVFLLHENIRPPKLSIAHFRNPETARRRVGEFIRLLERYFASIKVGQGEVALSEDDCERLIGILGKG